MPLGLKSLLLSLNCWLLRLSLKLPVLSCLPRLQNYLLPLQSWMLLGQKNLLQLLKNLLLRQSLKLLELKSLPQLRSCWLLTQSLRLLGLSLKLLSQTS